MELNIDVVKKPNNWHYVLKCCVCDTKILKDGITSKVKDWSIFLESLRSIKEKGFTYDKCNNVLCQNNITKQELISFDNKTKK